MLTGETQRRCLFCARIFEDENIFGILHPVFAGTSNGKPICPLCKARIKKEAGDSQRIPKAM